MARLTKAQRIIGIRPRGKYGRAQNYGFSYFGHSEYGDDNQWSGIYRNSRFADGKHDSLVPIYFPTNPRTVPQQAWRAVFTTGASTWTSLTDDEKKPYAVRAKRLHKTAFNVYMSDYLASHRL